MGSMCYACILPSIAFMDRFNVGDDTIYIKDFVTDIKSIEKRIRIGVNVENEQQRFTQCCSALEDSILPYCDICKMEDIGNSEYKMISNSVICVPYGSDYLDILLKTRTDLKNRQITNRSFFEPEEVKNHLDQFRFLAKSNNILESKTIQTKIAIFEYAIRMNCGIIEILNVFDSHEAQKERVRIRHNISNAVAADTTEYDPYDETYGDLDVIPRIRTIFKQAIEAQGRGLNKPVNISNIPHNVITEVLNDSIYTIRSDIHDQINLPIIYDDGSQGRPFPVECLDRIEPDNETGEDDVILRMALMSMRHMTMDKEMDASWFRNIEVSKSRPLADTDEFCYGSSKKQLEQFRTLNKPLKIYLYQTGFQPAVLGFYRALTEELLFRRDKDIGKLIVIPKYFDKRANDYFQGAFWI